MPIFNTDGWVYDESEIERICSKLPIRTFGEAAPHLTDSGIGETNLLYEKLLRIRNAWPYYTQELGDCFDENSYVKMADGSQRLISQVQTGEFVNTHLGRPKKVVRTIKKPYEGLVKKLTSKDDLSVVCTPDHKFLNKSDIRIENILLEGYKWRPLQDLSTNDVLAKDSSGFCEVGEIRDAELSSPFVYCLEVEDDHSFICNGFAVHNCVAHGAARAVMLLMAAEIINGEKEIYTGDISSEDLYGGSRIEIGRGQLGSGEGSIGSWVVEYMAKYGVLTRKLYGNIDLRNYDPKLARKWGNGGVPDELEQYSRDHTVGGFHQVSSYEEARDAINNDYPIIVCSDQGFRDIRDRQGYGVPSGRWMHCMTFVACHDSKRPALICDNTSWPKNWISGPKPEWAQTMPDGMFPVDAEIADRMLRQGDSYSISNFNGYKHRRPSFNKLKLLD